MLIGTNLVIELKELGKGDGLDKERQVMDDISEKLGEKPKNIVVNGILYKNINTIVKTEDRAAKSDFELRSTTDKTNDNGDENAIFISHKAKLEFNSADGSGAISELTNRISAFVNELGIADQKKAKATTKALTVNFKRIINSNLNQNKINQAIKDFCSKNAILKNVDTKTLEDLYVDINTNTSINNTMKINMQQYRWFKRRYHTISR